jgi:uncharacterized protein DUF669
VSDDDGIVYGEDDLYVNFSDDEAASESRDYEPLPSGKYLVTITDVEMRESKSEKNFGKPMYSFRFTVVEDRRGGQFVGRHCWTLAMLFPPALFTMTHIMKALGLPVSAGRVRIPRPAELMDQQLMIGGLLTVEKKDKNDPSKVYPARFEPKSYWPASKWSEQPSAGTRMTPSKSGASSLLS